MAKSRMDRLLDIEVQQNGKVPDSEPAHARTLVGKLLDHANEPVLYARVRLTLVDDRARPAPALAQVNIGLNGRLVRAHAAATTMHEAIELMGTRLSIRLGRLARDWESTRSRRLAAEQEEHHRPAPGPLRPGRSAETAERHIVRHKAYTLGRLTTDDAVLEMERLDYDFHLFTETTTEGEAVVYRSGRGYQLLLSKPTDRDLGPPSTAVTYHRRATPILTQAEAANRLELSGETFVFFMEGQTQRGCVLYHRYNGDHGLIVPA